MTKKLLTPNPKKYVVFVDEDVDSRIVELCDKQEANIWLSSDINFTHDAQQWQNLTTTEKHYIKQILAFFATSDGIVGENLALNFLQEVQIPEVRYFYYFQSMIESVHAKTYSQMINTFIESKQEREELFESISSNPLIKKKAEWAFRYMDRNNASFSERLISFLAVEGIFFAGSFAAIFWLRDRGILSNSLGVANEYISRDETLHAEFASTLYKVYCNDLSTDKIEEILVSALEIEKKFIESAMVDRMFGMNVELMNQYLEYVTDMWLVDLGCKKKFNTVQPFEFMKTIGMKRKDNFFEKTVTNYARQTTHKALDWSLI